MEETEKRTEQKGPQKGPRLPWISTVEPTVFWGCALLVFGLGVVLPLWGIWNEMARLRFGQEIRGGSEHGEPKQRDGDQDLDQQQRR